MTSKISEQQLILSLIKDDLINSRLVNGLNTIGLAADDYLLHLSNTIFQLMEFEDNEQNEEIYEHYLNLTKKAAEIDITISHAPLDALALEIYIDLASRQK